MSGKETVSGYKLKIKRAGKSDKFVTVEPSDKPKSVYMIRVGSRGKMHFLTKESVKKNLSRIYKVETAAIREA